MKIHPFRALYDVKLDLRNEHAFEDIHITLDEFLEAKTDSLFIAYDKNRGGSPLNLKHVQKIRSELFIPSLGVFTFAMHPDLKKFVMYDGHNRTEAVMQAFWHNELTDTMTRMPVLIRVIPHGKAIKTYTKINDNEKHTVKNKILNSDLAGGHFIEKVSNDLGGVEIPSGFQKTIIQQALIISEGKYNNDYYENSKTYSRKVGDLLNREKGESMFSWSRSQNTRLIDGLNMVFELFAEIKENNKFMSKTMKTVIGSISLFGLLLADATSDKPIIFGKKTKMLAKYFIENDTAIWRQVETITKEFYVKLTTIYRLLRIDSDKYAHLESKLKKEDEPETKTEGSPVQEEVFSMAARGK